MNCSFHPAAEAEFLEAVGYYEANVSGLGPAFLQELEALAELIADSPKAWQVEHAPDVRSAPLRRFPLSIIYREKADSRSWRSPTINAGHSIGLEGCEASVTAPVGCVKAKP